VRRVEVENKSVSQGSISNAIIYVINYSLPRLILIAILGHLVHFWKITSY
jgi:hypothetical protein